MKLTEQQFLDGLNVDQAAYFNDRLIEIRTEFQESYAQSVASVAAAKDQLLIDKTAVLEAEQEAHDATRAMVESLTAEVTRLTAMIPPPVDPNAVPGTITRTQARLVLHRAGLLDKVLEVIAAGGVEAQIWYEANEWNRASPVLAGMAQALGFTDVQVDNLFRAAGAIVT